MIEYSSIIQQFDKMGEKTGWTYLDVPANIAQQIKADCKVSFRVKGEIDEVVINGIAILPMGEGDFILALKKELLKKIGKRKGATVRIVLQEDKDFKIEMPEDLEICLSDVVNATEQFYKMAKSHQNYYINWINAAKTESTRVKRLSQTVEAMEHKMDYGEMIRYHKEKSKR